MYSPELENLIDLILADDEVTEKEWAVLRKRAEAEGVDFDELEIVVEGKLAKKKKEAAKAAAAVAPQTPTPPPFNPTSQQQKSKFGIVEKCPNCGAVVEAGNVRCSDCGYEFRGVEAVSSVQKFSDGLNEIERRHGSKSETSLSLKQITLNSLNPFFADPRTTEISSFIKNFPIPNSKEDLLEFIVFLQPKAELSIYNATPSDRIISNAYETKYNECIRKAQLYFREDPQFQALFKKRKKGFFGFGRFK